MSNTDNIMPKAFNIKNTYMMSETERLSYRYFNPLYTSKLEYNSKSEYKTTITTNKVK